MLSRYAQANKSALERMVARNDGVGMKTTATELNIQRANEHGLTPLSRPKQSCST
jgi:hypothetical protein